MNTTTIDLAVSQPTLSDLLKITAAGNEVVLVNAGEPVARMTPDAKPEPVIQRPRIPGLHPGAIVFLSDDWDDPLPDEFWLSGDP